MAHILSLSYGKDSIACIEACRQLGYPIDRIVHAEVWATDTIPADLPPMVEFKKKADAIIKERYGLEVEHVCAMCSPDKKYGAIRPVAVGGRAEDTHLSTLSTSLSVPPMENIEEDSLPSVVDGADISSMRTKKTYIDIFYRRFKKNKAIYGFPIRQGNWCTSELKTIALER